jgi:hypothetical protein
VAQEIPFGNDTLNPCRKPIALGSRTAAAFFALGGSAGVELTAIPGFVFAADEMLWTLKISNKPLVST